VAIPDYQSLMLPVLKLASDGAEHRIATELIPRICAASPEFFERLVVDLLLKMGYGGSRAEAGRALGKTGDGGIDGVIDQDQLGLDRIYLQAKKYDPDNAVSEPKLTRAPAGANVGVFVASQECRCFRENYQT
jgi:restriction system protein